MLTREDVWRACRRCWTTSRSRPPSPTAPSSSPSTTRSPTGCPGEIIRTGRGRRSRSTRARRADRPLQVVNTGDRPVQVGSHYHFAAGQRRLAFDRHGRPRPPPRHPGRHRGALRARRRARRVRWCRSPVPAGRTGEPARPSTAGALDDVRSARAALRRAVRPHHRRPDPAGRHRPVHRDHRGPQRRPGAAGDEAVFGGGKVIRESMGQARATRAEGAPDTGDHRRGDPRPLGNGQGRRRHSRRPDRRDRQGRQPRHHGRRRTPTWSSARPPRSSPATARSSPPAPSTPTCTSSARRSSTRRSAPASPRSSAAAPDPPRAPRPPPSPRRLAPRPGCWSPSTPGRSTSRCSARATRSPPRALWEQLRAGASGFKLHEDWGTTPAAIDACLTVADASGVQVAHPHRHAQRGRLRRVDTLAAIGDRAIHAYHTEGAGGGHAPDIITRRLASRNVLPSSTNPTRPHTVNTLDEHLDMLMVCHHLNPASPRGPGLRRVAGSGRPPWPPRTSCTTSAPSR